MSKISRNDPCLCGSGKKYKKCCIDRVLPFPVQNNLIKEVIEVPSSFKEAIEEHLSKNEYNSLDEMYEALQVISNKQNSLSVPSFLGLSPTDIHELMYKQFDLDNGLFKFGPADDNDLLEIPILKQSLYFLSKLEEVDTLKATKKGNLPKVFVIEMYEKLFSTERYARKPNKEDDLQPLVRLRHLLDMSGLIKKRSNKFSLTKKGISMVEKRKIEELYKLLFLTFVNEWNWGFSDGYPDLDLIQQSASFNFFILNEKCEDWVLDMDLGQIYLDAFPDLVNEVSPSSYSTPEKQIINCFSIRFLNRFCVPFGLLELKEEKVKKKEYFEFLEYYRKTSFFEKNFKFRVE